jgi:hypothetical protein
MTIHSRSRSVLCFAFLCLLAPATFGQTVTVVANPTVSGVTPGTVAAATSVTLTVTGLGFLPGDIVETCATPCITPTNWTTTFLNSTTLTAVVQFPQTGAFTVSIFRQTVPPPPPPAAYPVWVVDGTSRVGLVDSPGTVSGITVSGGRGETVDAQIAVAGPVGNVNLTASALTGPATIPASAVTVYREYFLTVTGTNNYGGGSNPPLGSGTYAEPLIPFTDPETGSPLCATTATLKACNATVAAGKNQPYWIDIAIPRGLAAPPGVYTGTISVTATQGTVLVPVSLTVWNFELPLKPTELSEWTLWNPASGNTVTSLADALMRNKVMSRYDAAANAAFDVANFGLNRSGLDGYYFIGIQCNGSSSSSPTATQISAAAGNYPAGVALDFYVGDELNGCPAAYPALKTMAADAHSAGVKTILTINAPDANLYGAVDHWVLLDALEQWPALPFTAGGDLWSYTSCNTGFGNTPEWMVDYPPINERLQAGFLNWAEGATGILYYRADGWTNGNAQASWDNVNETTCGSNSRPGDGIFLYPPGPIGSTESAPGIRLKAIRDGIQDYEYAAILNRLGQSAFLNATLQPIAGNWKNWNHSPALLEAAKTKLGQLLTQLAP